MNYELLHAYESTNKKFNLSQISFIFSNSTQIENFLNAFQQINSILEAIVNDFIKNLPAKQLVQLEINHDALEFPISSNFIKAAKFRLDDFMSYFDLVAQSRKRLPYEQTPNNHYMRCYLTVVDTIEGSGMKRKAKDMSDFCENFKGAVRPIINKDNLCLVRAIILGKAIADKEDHWNDLERPNNRKMKERVTQLIQQLNLPTNIALGLDHVKQIDKYFGCEYQISVFSADRDTLPVYYDVEKGKNKNVKFINILYHELHFNTILSIKRFYNTGYFCDYCKKKFSNLGAHKCQFTCKACNRFKCYNEDENDDDSESFKSCNACKIECNNQTCYDMHIQQFCFKKLICNTCQTIMKKPHICLNEKWCENCKQSVEINHKCFIKTADQIKGKKREKKFNGFIFFDFECYKHAITGEHIVNLAMAQRICKSCLDLDTLCDFCNTKIIHNNIGDFVDWMLDPINSNFSFIAHNSKAYDSYMIINEFQKRVVPCDTKIVTNVNGTKILYLKFRDIEIKDSSLFIPMRLDQFSKAFGIKELKKGFFPHEFNLPQNENYIGPYPDKSFYGYQFMSLEKKKEFDVFYESVKNKTFNFQQEFHDYCWSDVQLLTQGCIIFSRLNRGDTKRNDSDEGICPFQVKTTLASFCNFLYIRNFMTPNTLPLLPAYGYNPKANMSRECELWIKYLSYRDNIQIRHAKNGGERQIDRYFVDGFCETNKTIYEFNGCIFHGCPHCFSENTCNPIYRVLNSTLLLRTVKRQKTIQQVMPDYKIHAIWGHEWEELKKTDQVKDFLAKLELSEPLNPREALYGGRTNALKLYYKCSEPGEKINYIDYTSLYPYVQKYGVYPIDHPEIITENFTNKKYFGLIKCRILAPHGLYIPVLPARINGKLVFTLCKQCAQLQNNNKCDHTDIERALDGTWCTLEVDKALENGYKIIQIFEVWHWEKRAQYDPDKQSEGIFEKYVNQALKEKQEASGYPDNCVTDEQKEAYIKNYFDHEGILMDKEKIEKNPGRRQVAKLKANSLWGYFALNSNKRNLKIVTSLAEWHNMLNNDRYIIHSVNTSNENFIQVQYSENKEVHFGSLTTNVVIASFVTCQARLKLLSELHKLERRVLYFDTDSIFYISKPQFDYEPVLGNYLGDFTNEIDPRDGNYITEFVSAGPKNYGYKLDTGITECVVKGITFNSLTSEKINFESIRDIVCAPAPRFQQTAQVPQFRFIRDRDKWVVTTTVLQKTYRVVYDKRVINDDDLSTLPYGY